MSFSILKKNILLRKLICTQIFLFFVQLSNYEIRNLQKCPYKVKKKCMKDLVSQDRLVK
jgi:hypothetical protein